MGNQVGLAVIISIAMGVGFFLYGFYVGFRAGKSIGRAESIEKSEPSEKEKKGK